MLLYHLVKQVVSVADLNTSILPMDAKDEESDLLSLTGITRSRFSGYDLSLCSFRHPGAMFDCGAILRQILLMPNCTRCGVDVLHLQQDATHRHDAH